MANRNKYKIHVGAITQKHSKYGIYINFVIDSLYYIRTVKKLRLHFCLQDKCEQYWPDRKDMPKEIDTYLGEIVIRYLDEKITVDYILREFEISRVKQVNC